MAWNGRGGTGAKQEMTLDEAMAGLPPDFAFFRDRFDSQVRPKLAARENDRIAAVKRQQMFTIYAVIATLAVAGGVYAIFHEFMGMFFGAVLGFGVYAYGSMPLNKLGKETKLMLVEPVSSEFGMAYDMAPGAPPEIYRLKELGLVPGWDRASFEDRLAGERKTDGIEKTQFVFFEAHLEEKRTTTDSKGNTRTTWVTVFRGQCLIAQFHKPFQGVTKVFRDAGAFNFLAKLGKGYPRVKLEDPEFEKAFEVYGSDQIEARFILTPDFMERLLKLEKTFEGKKLRCAFAGGEMLLAVEGKNLLEPGSMHRRMDDLGRVHEMLHDFAAIFLLIDAMAARRTPEALRNLPG